MTYTDAQIAQVCHEANRALQTIHVTEGDRSVAISPPWPLLDDETRTSAIQGVVGVLGGQTPEQSHEAWCDFKRAHGWTYGHVKDDVTKKHPCLVPYDELPPEHRRKDHLFAAVVNALGAIMDDPAPADPEAARIRSVIAPYRLRPGEYDRGGVITAKAPRVGEIVHYVSHGTPRRKDGTQAYTSECRAAVVTQVGLIPFRVGLCVLNPTGQFFNEWQDHDPGTYTAAAQDSNQGAPEDIGCHELDFAGGSWHRPAG